MASVSPPSWLSTTGTHGNSILSPHVLSVHSRGLIDEIDFHATVTGGGWSVTRTDNTIVRICEKNVSNELAAGIDALPRGIAGQVGCS